MRLLIVEDDAAFRNFLRVQIAEEAPKGVPDIFEAATLTDALEIVHEEQIDAVLSDGSFPPPGAKVWDLVGSGGRAP
jgi:CheY-like chemotaxis protein